MSVLVYIENWDGKFKKATHEICAFASALAQKANTNAVAVSIGNVNPGEFERAAQYGISKIVNVTDEKLSKLDNKAYTSVIHQVAEKENADFVVFAHNYSGKALSPRVAARLKAGLVSGVVELPSALSPVTIKNKCFTGKAFAKVVVNAEKAVFTLAPNSFEYDETQVDLVVEDWTPNLSENDFQTSVNDVKKVTGKVLLNDADIVVSGGRGMKGPENWRPIEELAGLLKAATACSRPVSDEGWRPHEEHTGQTGKIIAPNLYFAFGISGAIQHVAGVNSSKCIVAVNKDEEAPIFEVADYGVIGDAMKVLPALIDAVKEWQQSS